MGEVDTKPFESVQAALSLFEEKSDQRKHRSTSTEGKLDSEEKDLDLLLKDLANYKLQVEVKDSAYKQALLKLDIYQQVVDEISTKLKNSEATKEKYYEECAEARSCANELESKIKDLGEQLEESVKAKEQFLHALEKSKAVEEELVAAQAELKAVNELKLAATEHAEQMEFAVGSEKEKNGELLERIKELNESVVLLNEAAVEAERQKFMMLTDLENQIAAKALLIASLNSELDEVKESHNASLQAASDALNDVDKLRLELELSKGANIAIEAEAAKNESRRLKQANSFIFSSKFEDFSQDLQVTTPRLMKLASFTEEGRDGFDPQIMISMLEYESLIRRAEKEDQTASFPTQVALNLIAYDSDSEFVMLKKVLEASMAEIKELKQFSEKAVHRAEMAERAKEAVEDQLRKWREQKQRRRVALASFRMQKDSNPARFDKTASMYEALAPLGKVLNMKV